MGTADAGDAMSLSAEQVAMRTGRNGFVGASEIAAAVGVSRWQAPIDLWLRKTGRAEDNFDNPRAAIGLRAEKVVIDWYCEDTGTPRALCIPGESRRHKEHSFAGCTPDFLRKGPGGWRLVQLKCVGARMAVFWPDEWIPDDVETQVQFEMECTRVEQTDVVAWLGGTDFRIITVDRDPEFGAMLIEGARDFWRYVENDEPPPVDGSEGWRRYLTAKFPKVEKQELDPANDDVDRYALESLRHRERIAEAEADQEAADNNLRALIGDRAGYLGSDYIVTWNADKNGKRTLRVKRRKNPND